MEENDVAIVHRLAGSFAYAWKAVAQRSRIWPAKIKTPSAWLIGAAIVSRTLCTGRVSTVAPVKVMANEPTIVSAPMDGVIAEGPGIATNTVVAQARPLFRYEDTNLRNQFQVAEKQLAVAEAEHAQAIQGGFADPQRKPRPLKAAEAALKETELTYARDARSG